MSMNTLFPHAPGQIYAVWRTEMIDFFSFFYTPFPGEASSYFTKTAGPVRGGTEAYYHNQCQLPTISVGHLGSSVLQPEL